MTKIGRTPKPSRRELQREVDSLRRLGPGPQARQTHALHLTYSPASVSTTVHSDASHVAISSLEERDTPASADQDTPAPEQDDKEIAEKTAAAFSEAQAMCNAWLSEAEFKAGILTGEDRALTPMQYETGKLTACQIYAEMLRIAVLMEKTRLPEAQMMHTKVILLYAFEKTTLKECDEKIRGLEKDLIKARAAREKAKQEIALRKQVLPTLKEASRGVETCSEGLQRMCTSVAGVLANPLS